MQRRNALALSVYALLLRLFKANKWLDAGVTNDGQLQAIFMINF